MKIALALSKKGMGFTEPNPLVGAVVVKNGEIIASACHKKYGAKHAERAALEKITGKNTTLYVTLEPCAHFGKTPPCTAIIIAKQVERVVMPMLDPNPLVDGKGSRELEKNGIKTEVGLLADLARKINRHYLKFITREQPYVTIKAGVSLDGKLTDKYRQSQWITDKPMRDLSHSLRGEFSAVLVGLGTVMDDNPQLTVRGKAWSGKSIYRVVLDSQNKLDKGLRVFQEQERFPLVLFSSAGAKNKEKKVAHHFFITGNEYGLDLKIVLKTLGSLGIASLLVEGGGSIIDSFLGQGFYDEIILFTADKLIGGKAAVELFSSGASLTRPVKIARKEIIEFASGRLVRGYRV